MVFGGKGSPWNEQGNKITAFDVTASGALQLREHPPYWNILRTLDALNDPAKAPYNGGWFIPKGWSSFTVELGYVRGEDPVDFTGGRMQDLVDGNSATMEFSTIPYYPHQGESFTFEIGLPVRVNRLAFYPSQEGFAADVNTPYRDTYMKAFEASAGIRGPQELETNPPRGEGTPLPTLQTLLRHLKLMRNCRLQISQKKQEMPY